MTKRSLSNHAVLLFVMGWPSQLLAQSVLHEIMPLNSGVRTGWSVAGAGDFNADGTPDFVVGSPEWNNRGRARVYSGSDWSLLYSKAGAAIDNDLGGSVDGCGDVNGDGFDDVIIGARSIRAIVASGADGSLLYDIAAGVYDFGFAVAGVGDLNQDGFDDFAVGSPWGPSIFNPLGVARAYSGLDGSVMFTWNGNASGDQFGSDIAAAGDVNADGHPDVIVGMRGPSASRYARVFSGADGSLIHQVNGSGAFGLRVSGAGDLDGDGHHEFMVGDPGANPNGTNSGSVTVFSGLDGSPLMTLDGKESFEGFGESLHPIDDVDQDGVSDLLIGATGAHWLNETGTLSLVSGADGIEIFRLHGSTDLALMGYSCGQIGDINGDGFPEIIGGAPGNSPGVTNGGSAVVISTVCVDPVAQPYCYSLPNSDNFGALIHLEGSSSLTAMDTTLVATCVPPGNFGLFFWGSTPGDQAFGDGRLCIQGPLIRLTPPIQADANGVAQVLLDNSSLSTPLEVGNRPHLQFWFRDPGGPGGSGFNTSNGLKLTMCE